mmetsp:Transcript_19878/g.40401  ORF Transcript_19878/g.40401 Transcript_19878/m.40401 type:complete len:493 (-) Transcript_19878:450-1928(-)
MTLTRRTAAGRTSTIPEYGDLMGVFQKPMEISAEEEEEEYEVIDTVEGGSLNAATFGIIKGAVGPAILFLPRGFKLAGWAVAIPALIFSTATYLYSASRLLECWKIEKRKVERLEEIKALLDDTGRPAYGSTETEGEAKRPLAPADPHMPSADGTLLTYPELARRAFGRWAVVVSFGIAVLQFGVCLTYFIFIPENMVQVTKAISGVTLPQGYFLICMIVMEIPFAWIRDIRRLHMTNILATLLIAFGLASCLGIALFKDYGDSSLVEQITELQPVNHDTWFMFIGTSFYMFEGSITLVVPLQEAVFTREDKAKFPALNNKVMCSIVTFYIFFATTCWAAYGDGIKTALTASLPPGTLATSVQIAYSVAVFFTFPLQAFPALEVTLRTTTRKTEKDAATALFQRNVKASFLIIGLGVIGYFAQDYLGNVASLLGSLVGVPIGLIFPNLMHNILAKDSPSGVRTLNYCVVAVGVVATIVASTTTILNWSEGAE